MVFLLSFFSFLSFAQKEKMSYKGENVVSFNIVGFTPIRNSVNKNSEIPINYGYRFSYGRKIKNSLLLHFEFDLDYMSVNLNKKGGVYFYSSNGVDTPFPAPDYAVYRYQITYPNVSIVKCSYISKIEIKHKKSTFFGMLNHQLGIGITRSNILNGLDKYNLDDYVDYSPNFNSEAAQHYYDSIHLYQPYLTNPSSIQTAQSILLFYSFNALLPLNKGWSFNYGVRFAYNHAKYVNVDYFFDAMTYDYNKDMKIHSDQVYDKIRSQNLLNFFSINMGLTYTF